MTNEAPKEIWIEDEFGEGHEDQWSYGSWDCRNVYGYVTSYTLTTHAQAMVAAERGAQAARIRTLESTVQKDRIERHAIYEQIRNSDILYEEMKERIRELEAENAALRAALEPAPVTPAEAARERIAKAICERHTNNWAEMYDADRDGYLADADAALRALAEAGK